MKISTKGRYGLRILLDLATHQKKGPVNLGDISKRQGISEKYLWQVINCLDKAESCDRHASCVTRDVWAKIENNMKKTMATITLQDLVEKQESNESGESLNYNI